MKFLRYAIIFGVITIIMTWWIFFRVSIDPDTSKVYRILITQEPSGGFFFATNENQVLSSWLLFYRYPQGNFFLFEIDDTTQVEVSEGFHTSIHQTRSLLKEKITEYYGVDNFDFEVRFTENRQLDFLNRQGGSAFFNLYSTNLPLGEVYINELNYTTFLQGIENPYLQKITGLGFWFNLLMSFPDTLPHAVYTEDYIKSFYKIFSGNLNYPTFWALVNPLLFDEEGLSTSSPSLPSLRDRITFKFDKNSIESIAKGERQIFVPYQKGVYDRNKILDELIFLETGEQRGENQSITAQIRNATSVPRLAARAAGFFRLRGINVVEYLGFNTLLKHSVILDYANQPIKRNYIKRVSKIDKVYHLFNYRENYDFGIYLGEDLFVLQNSSDSP